MRKDEVEIGRGEVGRSGNRPEAFLLLVKKCFQQVIVSTGDERVIGT